MSDDLPVEAILACWFGDAAEHPERLQAVKPRWFSSNADFDRELEERFGQAHAVVAAENDWDGDDMRERLARVILLDQFSRNIFRGTARAFAYDETALKLGLAGIDRGLDRALTPIERSFLAMPMQHAEDVRVQHHSVRYFESLALQARHPEEAKTLTAQADYARQHAEIIERFGRFPHRNATLGRKNTAEETAYLNDGAPRFGQ